MNDKLKMAHDYAMQLVASPDLTDKMSIAEFVSHCWKYADAMQAESDKRIAAEAQKGDDEVAKIISEWQPDWSEAPDGFNWWAMDLDGSTYWFCGHEPQMSNKAWARDSFRTQEKAGRYGYQGSWRESLRKRP